VSDDLILDAHRPDQRSYTVGGSWDPLASVSLGQDFAIRTLDASGNQMSEQLASVADLDQTRLFPATGPILVEGVREGDAVGIEVVGIVPVSQGHLWTRPGLGFGPTPDFHVRAVDVERLEFELGGASYPMVPRLHVGTLGLAPEVEIQARDVGTHGGNIDSVELAAGAVLWVRAAHDGGGVFAADVHAAIGDAEICGTGVEVEATLRLRVHRRDDGPELPVIRQGDRTWVVGTGSTFEEALDEAVRFVHGALVRRLAVAPRDAYLAVGAMLEVRVCQVVNPHTSVAVSLTSGLDRRLTDL
jgi:amidase